MNKYRYLPMTETDEQEMLEAIGINSTEELFDDIPEDIRFKRTYHLPEPPSEVELKQELSALAAKKCQH